MVAGLSPGVAAQAIGASRATGYRWWRRYVTAGWVGLQERPSTPQHQPRRLSPAAEAEILAPRRHSGAGPVTLGALLGRDLPFASVHAALTEAPLRNRFTHLAYLAEVLQAELDDREARRRERRAHEARFPRLKHLAGCATHGRQPCLHEMGRSTALREAPAAQALSHRRESMGMKLRSRQKRVRQVLSGALVLSAQVDLR